MTEENTLDENNPKLITDINKVLKLSNYLFPYQKGVDKSKLLIYDVCVYSITQPLEAKIIAQTIRDIFNSIQNIECYIHNQNQPRINPGDLTITDTTANIGGTSTASGALTGGVAGGGITLADTLTRIRITTVSGDTFDAGTINILYE